MGWFQRQLGDDDDFRGVLSKKGTPNKTGAVEPAARGADLRPTDLADRAAWSHLFCSVFGARMVRRPDGRTVVLIAREQDCGLFRNSLDILGIWDKVEHY